MAHFYSLTLDTNVYEKLIILEMTSNAQVKTIPDFIARLRKAIHNDVYSNKDKMNVSVSAIVIEFLRSITENPSSFIFNPLKDSKGVLKFSMNNQQIVVSYDVIAKIVKNKEWVIDNIRTQSKIN
jgi:hypothetical protein